MQLYSNRINDETFRLYIPEYYQPNLPSYYRNTRVSGNAVVNGKLVSDEEYKELTGMEVERDTFIPSPIFIAGELDMCISSCSTATIIDMDHNEVPFKFVNIEDIKTILAIIEGYVREMTPYMSRSRELETYIKKANSTYIKLEAAYKEISRDYRINKHLPKPKPATLAEILREMF